jgi:NADH-quinone oxidoreductase subunit G
MITVEINGQSIATEPGKMIIEVADNAGVYVPRFCYHKKLSIAANCRMCLVEVEKVGKTVPACATPVTDGMKVFTKSEKAVYSQRAVMEFLLINHPLDCPICDQGGECELQDVSMGYGEGFSHYSERKRVVSDEDLGSLIATDMTRCIHCTRCVRFGEEIAGLRELGVTGRGEHSFIGTFIKHSIQSEISGNVIDVCPVGALTSKPYRFTARAWELRQSDAVAPHDCWGSNIHLHTRQQEIMRVVPKENEAINEAWLSDRDRFSYPGLMSEDRLLQPLVKQGDNWQEASWEQALHHAADGIKLVLAKYGSDQVAALASPSATTEELFLWQKLMRGLDIANIDHRLQQNDFADQAHAAQYPGASLPLAELEEQQAILLVGSQLHREQPLAAVRVRKAQLHDAVVMTINPVDYDFHIPVTHKAIVAVDDMVTQLAQVAKALVDRNDSQVSAEVAKLLANCQVEDTAQAMARQLQQAEKATVILGAVAQNHPQAATLRSLAKLIGELSNSELILMTDGANSAGAWLAGALPHRLAGGATAAKTGLDTKQAFAQALKSYVLLNIEPELDSANPSQAQQALQQADFVVVLTPYVTPAMREYADVILPIAPFSETGGSYVNVAGEWQTFTGCVPPAGQSRPAWKVLRVLGNLLEVNGFDYVSVQQVLEDVRQQVTRTGFVAPQWYCPSSIELDKPKAQLTRIGEKAIYAIDNITRRSQPLQASATSEQPVIRIHPSLAEQCRLSSAQTATVRQHGTAVSLPLIIDERVAPDCIHVATGFAQTSGLGDNYGSIELLPA